MFLLWSIRCVEVFASVITTQVEVLQFNLLKGVESFLHKDVSFVVTGSQEYLKQHKGTDTKAAEKGSNDEAHHPTKTQESLLCKEKKRPGTPRPMVLNVTHVFYFLTNWGGAGSKWRLFILTIFNDFCSYLRKTGLFFFIRTCVNFLCLFFVGLWESREGTPWESNSQQCMWNSVFTVHVNNTKTNYLDIMFQELHKSSVLANAQSWGVKILFVDVILYCNGNSIESLAVNFSPQQMALC